MEKGEDVAKCKRPRDLPSPREGASAGKPKRQRKLDGERYTDCDTEFVQHDESEGGEGPGIGAPGIGAPSDNKGKQIKEDENSTIIPYKAKRRKDIPSDCKIRHDWRFRDLLISKVMNIKREICWAPAVAHCVEAFHNFNVKDIAYAEPECASVKELTDNITVESPKDTIGSIKKVFDWICENGLNREKDYTRRHALSKTRKALNIGGFEIWPNDKRKSIDEKDLFEVLKTTPVVGVIYFTPEFASYKKGEVYTLKTQCDENTMKHAVLIIGWATKNGIDFWLVRNCYEEDWGHKGYARIARQSCSGLDASIFIEVGFPTK